MNDQRFVRNLLNEYRLPAQKKYGQNFLTDEGVLDAIVEGAEVTKEDAVLEIGPGLGSLTRKLSEAAKKVIAVEIDRGLIPVLRETLKDCGNVTVINEDILKCDIDSLDSEYASGRGLKVVANLPYYITTPIVLRLLECGEAITDMTVMVQKEVAYRMQATPGSKDYGALTLAVGYYSDPQIITEVGPESFYPSPAVDSTVIRLKKHSEPVVNVRDPEYMFKLIRATFNMRRKTMPNALAAGGLNLSRENVEEALETMGKERTVRGETFSLAEFALLSDILSDRTR